MLAQFLYIREVHAYFLDHAPPPTCAQKHTQTQTKSRVLYLDHLELRPGDGDHPPVLLQLLSVLIKLHLRIEMDKNKSLDKSIG